MNTRNSTSRSLKAVALAAVLTATSWQAHAQTVVNLSTGQSVGLQDPLGNGRIGTVKFLQGSADTVFGTGDYAQTGDTFDIGGTLGAINVPKLQLGGANGVTISQQFGSDELGDSIRTGVTTTAGVSSLDVQTSGANSGKFEFLNLSGAVTMAGTRISGTLTGGSLQISQIRVGLASGQVVADLSGTKSAVGTKPAVAFNSPGTVLWTFDPVADVVGPTQIKPYSLLAANRMVAIQSDGFSNVIGYGNNAPSYTDVEFTAHTQINNLSITSSGAQFLIDALGLLATGQDALGAVNNSTGKWGSIYATMTFSTAPEPSTYALMGLGLVGIVLAASRKTPSV